MKISKAYALLGFSALLGLALTQLRAEEPREILPGDINRDCRVDQTDIDRVRETFGQVGMNLPADLNKDGRVGLDDHNIVRANYGKVCQKKPAKR
jgi:hypothetical protein